MCLSLVASTVVASLSLLRLVGADVPEVVSAFFSVQGFWLFVSLLWILSLLGFAWFLAVLLREAR